MISILWENTSGIYVGIDKRKADGTDMREDLLKRLSVITEEEQHILDGTSGIEKKLYTSGEEFTIDSAKMLAAGQLITVRPHTRFAHFPVHRHNYVEVMYVCEGSVTNIISGKEITVHKGELLFLNQYTRHEILPAGEKDIVINLIILPEFFDVATDMVGKNNVLEEFLVNTLRQDEQKGEYLYFKVSDVLQIQNLMENMIYSLVMEQTVQNLINQTTMGLLFLYLLDSVKNAETMVPEQYENMIVMTALRYIEENYRNASLTELSERLHLPVHTLSRLIKKTAGCNFKDLLQRKRLNKAIQLLCDTDLSIEDIISSVGYENHSYFHRIFRERYQMRPIQFRRQYREQERIRI